jgi:hypothetical protein
LNIGSRSGHVGGALDGDARKMTDHLVPAARIQQSIFIRISTFSILKLLPAHHFLQRLHENPRAFFSQLIALDFLLGFQSSVWTNWAVLFSKETSLLPPGNQVAIRMIEASLILLKMDASLYSLYQPILMLQ